MSDKPFDKLNELDRLLRRTFPSGPDQKAVPVTIEMVSGFELFNTRAYHNYETFSDGYRVSNGDVSVQAEDLDDAVKKFCEKVKPE